MTQPSFKDIENLTAYLDGQLDAKQTRLLESRLETDPNLRTTFDELRATRTLFRSLPLRRAPRNFTLTPKMAGIKPPAPRSYFVLRYASAFAVFLLFFAFAANFIAPIAAQQSQLASAPIVGGYGGGAPVAAEAERNQSGGGCDGCAEPTMEAAAPAPVESLPTPSPEFAQQADIESTNESAAAESAPSEKAQPAPASRFLVVSPAMMGLLLGAAILLGALAIVVRYTSDRKWSKANAATGQVFSKRDILLLVIAILLIVAAVVGIFQLARASAQVQTGLGGMVEDPAALPPGDKGSNVPPADKGNIPTVAPQTFTLTPDMGYGFSYMDNFGQAIAIDFPVGVVSSDADAMFTPTVEALPPDNLRYYSGRGFTLVVLPKELTLQLPLTVTVGYSDAEANGIVDESKFVLLWWDGGTWVDATTTCSPPSTYERLPDENKLRVNVCQFGAYLFAGVQ